MKYTKNGSEKIKHPSFGQISFARVSSNGQRFYGSELGHDTYIKMEVHGSEMDKSMSSTYYYADNLIMRLRLTSAQFAEMLTSMNYGSGVPCTLEYVDGKLVEPLPKLESHKDFIEKKFEERMEEFSKTLAENQKKANELINKKTLNKSDMIQLKEVLTQAIQEVQSNIPFFEKQFKKAVDKVVVDAKAKLRMPCSIR